MEEKINNNKVDNISNENNSVVDSIKEVIDSLRPYLNMDGGDVEFVDYKDHIVYVKLSGACQACMFSDETIKNGIFETLKSQIDEIEDVVKVDI